ncbi:hypothetical protein CgunFtcFv8_027551 [Champsocephalus gunnari]|uniref:Uncharacterized protein n=1 Tax=Champsocephalus gunnari TaxID=52237 RepID=A0AAN8DZ60_CHAGU|nr:hypothetical protein CgunFtcFv8_027551 [Champsocephalus gunnari]
MQRPSNNASAVQSGLWLLSATRWNPIRAFSASCSVTRIHRGLLFYVLKHDTIKKDSFHRARVNDSLLHEADEGEELTTRGGRDVKWI